MYRLQGQADLELLLCRLAAALAEMTSDVASGNAKVQQQMRQRATDPSADHSLRHENDPAVRTIRALRPSLMQSQLLLKTACFEPPWFGSSRIQLSKWGPMYGKLEAICTRVSVLESLLESERPLVNGFRASLLMLAAVGVQQRV